MSHRYKKKTGLEVALIGATGNHIFSTEPGMNVLSFEEVFSGNIQTTFEIGDYLSVLLRLSNEDGEIKGGIGLFQSLALYREGQREFSFFLFFCLSSRLLLSPVLLFLSHNP